jgi:hypothetical protein
METLLSSDLCEILFDPPTGLVLGVRDLSRKAVLAGLHGGGFIPFHVHGAAPGFKGMHVSRTWAGSILRAAWEAEDLLLDLSVFLGSRSACSTWTLDVTNRGLRSREARIEFPVLRGTGRNIFEGSPGCQVPWAALSDPAGSAGLGIIVRQQGGSPPGLVAPGGEARARLAPLILGAGRRVRAAEARILCCAPTWRPVARECAAWLGRSPAVQTAAGTARLTPDQLLALRLTFPGTSLPAEDPVTASLAGLPCPGQCEAAARDPLARAWACGCASALPALRDGELLDNPPTSDPAIVARMFRGRHMDAVVCARLPDPNEEGSLAGFHAPWEVAVPARGAAIPEVALCDLEDLSWQRLVPLVRGGAFRFDSSSNWVLCLVLERRVRLAAFEPLPVTLPGGSVEVRVEALAGRGGSRRVRLRAPGLRAPSSVEMGSGACIRVPPEARPGLSPVWIEGRRTPPFMRFLRVMG